MLDEKFMLKKFLSNIIQHAFSIFHEMLDKTCAFKRIQNFVQYCQFCMLDEISDQFKLAFNEKGQIWDPDKVEGHSV